MKLAAAFVALILSAPALATGGLRCRPVGGKGPELSLVIGHGAGAGIVSARLAGAGATIAQSWIDSRHLWLDLTDAAAVRYTAKLRATFRPGLHGRPALGTLMRGGRTYSVRCVEA